MQRQDDYQGYFAPFFSPVPTSTWEPLVAGHMHTCVRTASRRAAKVAGVEPAGGEWRNAL